jgi:hypothetical protein
LARGEKVATQWRSGRGRLLQARAGIDGTRGLEWSNQSTESHLNSVEEPDNGEKVETVIAKPSIVVGRKESFDEKFAKPDKDRFINKIEWEQNVVTLCVSPEVCRHRAATSPHPRITGRRNLPATRVLSQISLVSEKSPSRKRSIDVIIVKLVESTVQCKGKLRERCRDRIEGPCPARVPGRFLLLSEGACHLF